MIELILLGMLYRGQPYTGYDLRKMMAGSIEFFQSNSLGSIQPGLKKLAALGQVTTEVQVVNGRKKLFYQITEQGKNRFKAELLMDFSPDKIRCNQLVKVFFFDQFRLEERLASTKAYIEQLQQIRNALIDLQASAAPAAKDCLYQMDTLQFGLDYYQFLEDWFTKYNETLKVREHKTK